MTPMTTIALWIPGSPRSPVVHCNKKKKQWSGSLKEPLKAASAEQCQDKCRTSTSPNGPFTHFEWYNGSSASNLRRWKCRCVGYEFVDYKSDNLATYAVSGKIDCVVPAVACKIDYKIPEGPWERSKSIGNKKTAQDCANGCKQDTDCAKGSVEGPFGFFMWYKPGYKDSENIVTAILQIFRRKKCRCMSFRVQDTDFEPLVAPATGIISGPVNCVSQ